MTEQTLSLIPSAWEVPSEIQCPCCGDDGFDPLGFKLHIKCGWCDACEAVAEKDGITRVIL